MFIIDCPPASLTSTQGYSVCCPSSYATTGTVAPSAVSSPQWSIEKTEQIFVNTLASVVIITASRWSHSVHRQQSSWSTPFQLFGCRRGRTICASDIHSLRLFLPRRRLSTDRQTQTGADTDRSDRCQDPPSKDSRVFWKEFCRRQVELDQSSHSRGLLCDDLTGPVVACSYTQTFTHSPMTKQFWLFITINWLKHMLTTACVCHQWIRHLADLAETELTSFLRQCKHDSEARALGAWFQVTWRGLPPCVHLLRRLQTTAKWRRLTCSTV